MQKESQAPGVHSSQERAQHHLQKSGRNFFNHINLGSNSSASGTFTL